MPKHARKHEEARMRIQARIPPTGPGQNLTHACRVHACAVASHSTCQLLRAAVGLRGLSPLSRRAEGHAGRRAARARRGAACAMRLSMLHDAMAARWLAWWVWAG